jgi:hypothetical protein
VKVKDVQIHWEKPESPKWKSAMYFQDVKNLKLEGFEGAPAKVRSGDPAVVFDQVEGADIVDSTTTLGTNVFLEVKGVKSRDIQLHRNEIHMAHTPYQVDKSAWPGAVSESDNY